MHLVSAGLVVVIGGGSREWLAKSNRWSVIVHLQKYICMVILPNELATWCAIVIIYGTVQW